MKPYLVGVDLGGTFIKTALITLQGDIVKKVEIPSEKESGPERVINNICTSIQLAVKEAGQIFDQVQGIGLGTPGPLNTQKGIVCNAVNIPGFINIPLRDVIQERFGIPAYLENDANAAGYGEYWKGAGRGSSLMVAYTLGTGVGGGIIIDGKLIRGANDSGGELGHMTIVPDGEMCSCGNRGCVEAYASATFLVKHTSAKLKKGCPSLLTKWLEEGKILTAKLIDEARRAGDAFSAEMLQGVGYYLGLGVANVVSALNPDVVVVGGGMMKAGEIILEPVRREVQKRTFREHYEHLRIVAAELGNDAGVIGAAGLALERAGIRGIWKRENAEPPTC
jgi:glucokinase